METQTVFPTKSLLRPDQVNSAKDEIKALESKLQNKHIEDKAEVSRQLRRAKKDFETQLPQPPANGEEEDRMVKRAKQLLSEITVGMCSQEEMRKAPAGAVDKHRAWEARNKPKIMEWKHIMLRMTAGSGDRDAANLEKHRPRASSLNMDSAQIPGKQFYMPETTGPAVTFSDAQIEALRAVDPDLAERLSTLSNPQRQVVKDIVGDGIGLAFTTKASQDGKKGAEKKRQMNKAQLEALARGRATAKANRDAKKA